MALFFSNSNIQKLSNEQFKTLDIIADACNAETINEASEEERNGVRERCQYIKEQAEKEMAAQKALQNSFI